LHDVNIKNVNAFVDCLVCSKDNFDCMHDKCLNCKNFKQKLFTLVPSTSLSSLVTYQFWVTGNKVVPHREPKECNVEQLLDKIAEDFVEFKIHSHAA
jgi:hypothetical protein